MCLLIIFHAFLCHSFLLLHRQGSKSLRSKKASIFVVFGFEVYVFYGLERCCVSDPDMWPNDSSFVLFLSREIQIWKFKTQITWGEDFLEVAGLLVACHVSAAIHLTGHRSSFSLRWPIPTIFQSLRVYFERFFDEGQKSKLAQSAGGKPYLTPNLFLSSVFCYREKDVREETYMAIIMMDVN